METKSEKTKALILKSASELFSNHGYQNTPVSQILVKAGISKGGFYHHFKSKEDIVDTLARLQVDDMAGLIKKISEDEELSAIEKFNKLIEQVQQVRTENRDQLFKLFEAYMRKENLFLKEKMESYTLKMVKPAYTKIILQGVEEGAFHTSSPELAAELIIRYAPELRMKMAKLYLGKNSNKSYKREIAKIADFLEEFVIKVLGAKQGSIRIATLFKSFFSINH